MTSWPTSSWSTSATPARPASAVIPGSVNIPLPELLDRLGELDQDRPTALACASGYRSSIAASTLAAHGFTDVSDLLGGYDAWAKAGQPVEALTDPRPARTRRVEASPRSSRACR